MSEMIERVAKVLMKSSFSCSWEQLSPHYQEGYLSDARAAIEAMREPTEEMIGVSPRIPGLRAEIIATYKDMIDSALNPSQT